MASVNKSFVNTEDIELSNIDPKTSHEGPNSYSYPYEEALDLTGTGWYNSGLLLACFVVVTAMGIDIFGLGIVVAAAACDLGLGLPEVGVLSSMPFAGIIVMSYPWGYLSDTLGRRRVLLWAMGGGFFCAALSSLAPSWPALAALRFLSSALSSAAESATYALLGECCAARVRARYMLLMTSALMLTPTLYYMCAYLIMQLEFSYPLGWVVLAPWRLLALVLALPLGGGALLLACCHESPKFLVNAGREREAVAALAGIFIRNGGNVDDFPVKRVHLEEGRGVAGAVSLRSLWTQLAPLLRPPLLGRTLLLYYLTFVIYIANNSFAIILPTIFNSFFSSYAAGAGAAGGSGGSEGGVGGGGGFCALFASPGTEHATSYTNGTDIQTEVAAGGAGVECRLQDNTIWAGCVHGLSFFLLNAALSLVANRRKALTVTILVVAAAAAAGVAATPGALAGLALFYVFLTTAMVFGVVSSYFVDLYPTSYRGMVACLGMMVARLSAFAGTYVVSGAMTHHCAEAMYGATALVLSGAVAASFLPSDGT